MRVTCEKPVSIFTNEQIAKYEFCRMDSSKQAIKGALWLISIPFIVSMGIGAYSMAQNPGKRQPVSASKGKKQEKDVARVSDYEIQDWEVHATPVVER